MIENLTEEQTKELAKIAGGQATKTVEEVLPECSTEDKEATKKQLEQIKEGKDLDTVAGGKGLSKENIKLICVAAGGLAVGATITAGITIPIYQKKLDVARDDSIDKKILEEINSNK